MSLVKGGEARLEQGGRSRVIARETRTAFASATASHLTEFAARLGSGDLDQRALRHQLTLIRLVDAGYESARTGQTIRFTE